MPGQLVCQNTIVASSSAKTNEPEPTYTAQGLDDQVPSTSSKLPSNDPVSVSIVEYPAPIPKFSVAIQQLLSIGNKVKVMQIYGDIIKEACCFYSSLCPIETAKAKLSLANIGRTIVEKYPTLAVADYQNPWT